MSKYTLARNTWSDGLNHSESCWIYLCRGLQKHGSSNIQPKDLLIWQEHLCSTGLCLCSACWTVLLSSGRALESSQASAVCGERRHFQPGCAETNPEKRCYNFQKHGWYTQKSNMEPKNLQNLAVKYSKMIFKTCLKVSWWIWGVPTMAAR
jgi:hypothetical protein